MAASALRSYCAKHDIRVGDVLAAFGLHVRVNAIGQRFALVSNDADAEYCWTETQLASCVRSSRPRSYMGRALRCPVHGADGMEDLAMTRCCAESRVVKLFRVARRVRVDEGSS